MKQLSLQFNARKFNGPVMPDQDLGRQMDLVRNFMSDGIFRTLSEIAEAVHQPPASISAQLRNLRKPVNGGHTVNKRYVSNGLWVYQLILKQTQL